MTFSRTPPSTAPFLAGLAGALLLAQGCATEDFELDVTLASEVATVPVLSWTTPQEGHSWVEYGVIGSETTYATPIGVEAATHHELPLLGLPALTEVWYTAYTETEEGLLQATGATMTSALPSDLPDVEITVHESSEVSAERYMMFAVMGATESLMAVDREGHTVWYCSTADLVDSENVMFSEVALAKVDAGFEFIAFSPELESGKSGIFHADIYGQVEVDEWLDIGHHTFWEHDDGTLAYVSADPRVVADPETGEDITVVGDTIREILPSGETREVFSAWDWGEVEQHDRWDMTFWEDASDWTHANGLEYDAETDHYLFSLGFLDTVLEVDRETGEVVREFGGSQGMQFQEEDDRFFFPHDPNWTADGNLLLFSAGEGSGYNKAAEYRVNEEDGILEEVWSFGDAVSTHSVADGQARRLENGNTLISWSSAGVVREVNPEGEVVWEMTLDAGSALAGAFLVSDLYDAAE